MTDQGLPTLGCMAVAAGLCLLVAAGTGCQMNDAELSGAMMNQVTILPGVPVNRGVFGANNMQASGDNWPGQPRYRALVKALGVQLVRYPAGSPASFWDWRNGHYIPEEEITAIWPAERNWLLHVNQATNALPAGTLGPVRYQDFAAAVDADVQWIANVTTREAIQPEMFAELHAHNVPVKYVEMDNEAYFWTAEYGGTEGGRAYARRVAELSPRIRKLYPDAKIGVVVRESAWFTETEPHRSDTQTHWNEFLADANFRPHYDAFILHHYAMNRGALDAFGTDADRGKAFLAFPQATLERAARMIKQEFGGVPMWITEYNVIAYHREMTSASDQWIAATKHTPWNALYQAGFWLTAMARPDAIEILNHHSITNVNIGWGLAMPIDESRIDLSATGQLFAHLSHLAALGETMHPVSIAGNPELGLTIAGEEGAKSLQAVAIKSGGKATLIVINRSGEPVAFTWAAGSAMARGGLRQTTYRAEQPIEVTARVQLDGDTPVWAQGPMSPRTARVRIGAQGAFALAVPAYSLSIIQPVSE